MWPSTRSDHIHEGSLRWRRLARRRRGCARWNQAFADYVGRKSVYLYELREESRHGDRPAKG